jgi:hypothetical protein
MTTHLDDESAALTLALGNHAHALFLAQKNFLTRSPARLRTPPPPARSRRGKRGEKTPSLPLRPPPPPWIVLSPAAAVLAGRTKGTSHTGQHQCCTAQCCERNTNTH